MRGFSSAARIAFAAALVSSTHAFALEQSPPANGALAHPTSNTPAPNAFIAPGSVPPGVTLHSVDLEAKLTENGSPVQDGLIWYVFSPIPGHDGKLPLVASSKGGSANFRLAPGDYFVNVSFGRAGATRRLTVSDNNDANRQTMVLDAGGLLLNAVSGSDVRIRPDQLSFSIYSSEVREDGERGLVMADVQPNTVVRLNAGTYHIVSQYGNVNASVRADIQVEAGKLTQATIQHKAAQITFKLVSEHGAEAIADTAWSILTKSGDSVGESVSAFPTMVLSEGQYTAVARNKDKIYQRDFKVSAGRNIDVEVLMADLQPQQPGNTAARTLQVQQPIPGPPTGSDHLTPLPSFEELRDRKAAGEDAD